MTCRHTVQHLGCASCDLWRESLERRRPRFGSRTVWREFRGVGDRGRMAPGPTRALRWTLPW